MALAANLHVYQDPALDGPTNMARDEHLLHSTGARPAAIRTYAWDPPTISLGYFQRAAQLAELPDPLRSLAVVRRLTGGGAILHDQEITYCLVADTSLPMVRKSPASLYELVHSCWRDVLAASGIESMLAPDSYPLPTPRTGPFFCFERPGRTDLIVQEQKLLGSAQRRLPDRVLQHGSLLLRQRFADHPGADPDVDDTDLVATWVDDFLARLGEALGLAPRPTTWSAEQEADIADRRERYASATWTEKY